MGRNEEAEELRRRAAEKDRESRENQWHPTAGKQAADEEDELFNKARNKQWDDVESDGE